MAGVLLFGNLRSSLTLAREFTAAGHEVHAGVDELSPYLFASRAVSGAFRHGDPVGQPDRTLTQLATYLEGRPEIDTLVPVSEMATRLVVRNRDRIPPRVRIAAVTPEVLEACVDKEGMFRLCERVGAPIARREIVADHESLLAAVERIGRPCVVKPVDSSEYVFGHKAMLLTSQDVAERRLPSWPARHRTVCVQRYVAGVRHSITFAAHEGRLLGATDWAVLHTDRPDGTGYTTGLRPVPAPAAIRDSTERLIRALNYAGAGDIEFVLDEAAGELTFLELNPRVGASLRTAAEAGLPVFRWMLEMAHGGMPEPLAQPWVYRKGPPVVWTKGAVSGVLRRRRAGELSAFQTVAAALRIAGDAARGRDMVFTPGDPGPAVWDWLHPVLTRLRVHEACVEPERDVSAASRDGLRPAT